MLPKVFTFFQQFTCFSLLKDNNVSITIFSERENVFEEILGLRFLNALRLLL